MDMCVTQRNKTSRKNQDHEVIFRFEYYVVHNLKLKCGLSTTRKFFPMQQSKNNFIGFDKDEWMQLLTYKEFI